jgi:hypothetical protein
MLCEEGYYTPRQDCDTLRRSSTEAAAANARHVTCRNAAIQSLTGDKPTSRGHRNSPHGECVSL